MPKRIPGEFVPLDVHYSADRALVKAGPMAELLYVRGLAYAKEHKETDGHLPDFDLPVFGRGIPNPSKHAAALVREQVWLAEDEGWRIRTWAKWNPTSAELREDTARKAAGAAYTNHVRWHVEKGVTDPTCDHCTDRSSDRTTDRSPVACGEPSESQETEREIETERETSSSSPDVPRARAPKGPSPLRVAR